jgi:uncharacterized protein
MSDVLTHPGVYIREVPSGVRPIIGVSTSTTAFVGRARRGSVDDPIEIFSFADYERRFGGLWTESRMSFAVQQYFLNGGRTAVIVRVHNRADAAIAELTGPAGNLHVAAANPGRWGDGVSVTVDHDVNPDLPAADQRFNLTVVDDATQATETHRNLSLDEDDSRFVTLVLSQQSQLLRVDTEEALPGQRPDPSPLAAGGQPIPTELENGDDGDPVNDGHVTGDDPDSRGFTALEDADIFNILCLPPLAELTDVAPATWESAAGFCRDHRAVLLIDTPSGQRTTANAIAFLATLALGDARRNVALYFPRLRYPNPLKEGLVEEFAPCGAVAGIYARIDAARGVWKAPAGQEAGVVGTDGPIGLLTDTEQGLLNPRGINVLRTFPVFGTVVWGARTVDGADRLASEWKYVPVRRTALFIQETLQRNLQWVVFEPNDEPLWAQIRLNVGAFMHDLFRQGAFQGDSPRDAYLVKCDADTTTQTDIDRGIVNILVGFAPLKPAEFVVVRIQQLAGQAQT